MFEKVRPLASVPTNPARAFEPDSVSQKPSSRKGGLTVFDQSAPQHLLAHQGNGRPHSRLKNWGRDIGGSSAAAAWQDPVLMTSEKVLSTRTINQTNKFLVCKWRCFDRCDETARVQLHQPGAHLLRSPVQGQEGQTPLASGQRDPSAETSTHHAWPGKCLTRSTRSRSPKSPNREVPGVRTGPRS